MSDGKSKLQKKFYSILIYNLRGNNNPAYEIHTHAMKIWTGKDTPNS